MEQYKVGNAIVRVHGTVNQDNMKTASERFMKKVIQCRKEKAKNT